MSRADEIRARRENRPAASGHATAPQPALAPQETAAPAHAVPGAAVQPKTAQAVDATLPPNVVPLPSRSVLEPKRKPSDRIPATMRAARRWLLWRSIANPKAPGAKPRKVPFYADGELRSGDLDSPEDLARLVTFDEAIAAYRRAQSIDPYSGPAFALGPDGTGNCWQGIDLDDVAKHPAVADLADLVGLPGYVERSPSGNGWHAIGYGRPFPNLDSNSSAVEAYSGRRYFTVTNKESGGDLVDLADFVRVFIAPIHATGTRSGHSGARLAPGGELDPLDLVKAPADDIDLVDARWMLDQLGDDGADDRDTWMTAGRALHHQFGASLKAFELWDEWAQRSSKYQDGECLRDWSDWKLQKPDRMVQTIASLIELVGKESWAAYHHEKRVRQAIDRVAQFQMQIAKADALTLDLDIVPAIRAANFPEEKRDVLVEVLTGRYKALGTPRSKPSVKKQIAPPRSTTSGPAGHPTDGTPAPLPAEGFPHVSRTQDGEAVPQKTIENLAHMLRQYGITAYYDVIKKLPVFSIPGLSTTPDQSDNAAINTICSLAALNGIDGPRTHAFAETVAYRAPRNVIADWIKSVPWDSRDRLTELYGTLTPRKGYPIDLRDLLVRRWLISAVAAVLKPNGFYTKGVLSLQGVQSLGKSPWFAHLVPDQMSDYILTGAHLDPESRDSVKTAVSHWIVELGEADSTTRRDSALLKAFLSRREDKLRAPYARADSAYQRRTVFGATVNPEVYLHDETGNVRFFTIPVVAIRYQHGIDMQQLWAQVATLYESGERWWLQPDEEQRLEERNADHRSRSAVFEVLASSLVLDSQEHTRMSASDVLHALGYDRPTNAQSKECGAALRELLGDPVGATKGSKVWLVPAFRHGTSSTGAGVSPSPGCGAPRSEFDRGLFAE